MIDQIGGWSTAGVGQSYGEGYVLADVCRFMANGILSLGLIEHASNSS